MPLKNCSRMAERWDECCSRAAAKLPALLAAGVGTAVAVCVPEDIFDGLGKESCRSLEEVITGMVVMEGGGCCCCTGGGGQTDFCNRLGRP